MVCDLAGFIIGLVDLNKQIPPWNTLKNRMRNWSRNEEKRVVESSSFWDRGEKKFAAVATFSKELRTLVETFFVPDVGGNFSFLRSAQWTVALHARPVWDYLGHNWPLYGGHFSLVLEVPIFLYNYLFDVKFGPFKKSRSDDLYWNPDMKHRWTCGM